MNKTISVIIPVYNQIELFKQCIHSVCNQTYTALEIICVDDGSTDGVSDFLDQVSKEDKRIKVFHQTNQGESRARNVALKHAVGEYIAFVDCDDWIDSEMYEILIREAIDNDLDIAASSWYKECKDNGGPVINEKEVPAGVIGCEEFLRYVYMRDSYQGIAYMWNKIYKRETLMDERGLREFDENKKLGGDVIYLAQAILHAKRIMYIDKPFYHYRIRENSGSHTKQSSSMRDWVESYEYTIKLLKKNTIPPLTIDYAKRFLAYHAMEGLKVAIENGDEKEIAYFLKKMSDNREVYCSLNADHPERIQEYSNLLGML